MTTLSSLVVARRAASIAEVDEALAHQVVRGGDLGTCLLELGALSELSLLPLLAEAYGMPPASSGELSPASASVLAIVPAAVAARHGFYPFDEHEGELRVAVGEPLPQVVEDDLGFALGAHLRQYAAPMVRVRQAIARDYGLSLDRRFLRLLAKLENRVDPSPSAAPPRRHTVGFSPDFLNAPLGGPLPAVPFPPITTSAPPSFGVTAPSALPAAQGAASSPASGRATSGAPGMIPPVRRNTWPGMMTSAPAAPPAGGAPSIEPSPIVTLAAIDAGDPIGIHERITSPAGPSGAAARGASLERADQRGAADLSDIAPDSSATPVGSPSVRAPLLPSLGGAATLSGSPAPPIVSPSAPLLAPSPVVISTAQASPAAAVTVPVKRAPAPPPEFVLEATSATAAQVERKRRRRAEQLSSRALAGWARRALGNTIPADRSPEWRRGPLTPAAAELKLDDAQTGEEVLAVFFAFARQYFEYSALFMVHGDLAAGHDAAGPGASRDKVRAIGVALDLPGALSHARERAAPVVAPLRKTGLDADLRADLGRTALHDVLVLPVMVLGRCVALLYGDHGSEPVESDGIGEVFALTPLIAGALERILLRRKRAHLRETMGPEAATGRHDVLAPLADAPPAGARPRHEDPAPRSDTEKSMTPPADMPLPGADGSLPTAATHRGGWLNDRRSNEDWLDDVPETTLDTSVETSSLRPSSPPSAMPGRLRSPPPPPQVAAVRPISRIPIAREEADDSAPDLMLGDADDVPIDEVAEDDLDGDTLPPANSGELGHPTDRMSSPFDPLASSSVSADPHAPPASRGQLYDLPPVLIRPDLVDQVVAGGEKGDKALGEILALGEAAIPSVFARFPGPLTVDRRLAMGDLPRPADCGPVLRIVAAMRRLALPFLAVRSADADSEIRFWATYLLGELCYGDVATALLPRLFDENTSVRRIAVRSARALVNAGDEGTPLRKSLERMVVNSDDPEQRRLIAIWTIGELRLYRSIPSLIVALSDPSEPLAEAALRALGAMTRQEFGRDASQWNEWWETKGRHRLK